MREVANVTLVVPNDVVIAQTAVVTTCLALAIWLGLLGRPSKAALLWTLGLALALLGSYGMIVAAATGTDVLLHPVPLGLVCGMPTLFWSALRVARGEHGYGWTGFAQSGLSLALLWATTNTANGFIAFRLVFFGAAVGAALGAVEVLRPSFRSPRFALPLVVASGAFVLLATVGLVGAIGGLTAISSAVFARGVLIAGIVYLICSTVTFIFVSNRRAAAGDMVEAMDAMAPLPLMRALVRERLERARARQEQNWSFVDLRLDDAADLRDASGELAYAAMVANFEDLIIRTFPSDADLGRVTPGHVLIFVSQTPGVVRELVRTVLNETARDDDARPASFRLSASAGIALVDPAVDTFDSIVEAAGGAADAAQLDGGDRWVRVTSTGVTERSPR